MLAPPRTRFRNPRLVTVVFVLSCFLVVAFHRLLLPDRENFPPQPWKWAENVDFVFTWVNGSDPEWLTRRLKVCPTCPMQSTSNDRSNDELKYSLRSIAEYAPWHKGRVILVTPAQVPAWLNTANPRIQVINQDDILPPDIGFTTNTFIIAWYLDRIPGLSERFVCIEDDNFADSPVHPSTFFTRDRAIRFFDNAHFSTTDAQFENATREEADEAYRRFLSGEIGDGYGVAGKQTSAALKEVFDDPTAYFFHPKHAPVVFKRSIYPAARLLFSKYLRPMHSHKRRHPLAVLPVETLRSVALKLAAEDPDVPFAEVAPPEECQTRFLSEVVTDNAARNDDLFARLLGPEKGKHTFFSLNDLMTTNHEIGGRQLRNFLAARYPVSSEFEK
ncbi:hypothetical protein DFH08DRAFT_845658 [Mycena albidolilacea]|uniref:Uncharacterized protein n=1 Tax=Mycena albidolilacea TaxID=1033008 RepID=A0AAD7AHU1_9AGAR|nr:hypothetical protein DFH08DRAFT_845658 [Mycena albidolilacea]